MLLVHSWRSWNAAENLKAVVAAFWPAFGPVIAPGGTTLSVGWDRIAFAAVYVALVPVQEFIARGVLQSSLERLMSGWKHPILWSVVLLTLQFNRARRRYWEGRTFGGAEQDVER